MPVQDRLRLYHLNRVKQIRPKPDQPNQYCSITAAQSEARWRLPQRNV